MSTPVREDAHDEFLEALIRNLDKIEENPAEICWMMRDGIWMKRHSTENKKLADLIIVYYDGTGSAVELKGSRRKRRRAIDQLQSSSYFMRNCLGIRNQRLKIAYYTNESYSHETIDFVSGSKKHKRPYLNNGFNGH